MLILFVVILISKIEIGHFRSQEKALEDLGTDCESELRVFQEVMKIHELFEFYNWSRILKSDSCFCHQL
jgi:hypothetical protein